MDPARPAGAPPPVRVPNAAAGLAAAAAAVAAAMIVMWPLSAAGFLQDDWTFLAISRHLPDPLAYFHDDHAPAYFYRPNGMLAWWLLNRAFGPSPLPHYLVQALLHAGVGVAIWALARRCGARSAAALAGAVLFVVHPAAAAGTAWLSVRFDVLATLGVLLCAWLAVGADPARPLRLAALAAAAWLAIGSKEIGVLAIGLVPLVVWLRADVDRRGRIAVTATMVAVAAAWAALRVHQVGPGLGRAGGDGLLVAAWQGIAPWFAKLPAAIALDGPPLAGAAALVLLPALAVAGTRGRSPRRLGVLIGVVLLLAPALVQWPITREVLSGADALRTSVNLRFYYLSAAGLALLAALAVESVAARGRRAGVAGALVAVALVAVPLGAVSRGRVAALAAVTADAGVRAQEAGFVAAFLAEAGGAGCKVYVEGFDTPNLPAFADHVAKAHVPRGGVALDALVVSDPMPWSAVVGPAGAAARAPLPLRRSGDWVLAPAPVGPLVNLYVDHAGPQPAACAPRRLRWDGRRVVVSDALRD